MTAHELDLLVVRTMATIMEFVEWDGEDIVVGQSALDALRGALVIASEK